MSRNIPISMVPNLEDAAPRWCYLLKVMPVKAESESNGIPELGITTWDQDITYGDSSGVVVYYARRGYDSYANQMTADLAVDNSEARFLVSEDYFDGVILPTVPDVMMTWPSLRSYGLTMYWMNLASS